MNRDTYKTFKLMAAACSVVAVVGCSDGDNDNGGTVGGNPAAATTITTSTPNTLIGPGLIGSATNGANGALATLNPDATTVDVSNTYNGYTLYTFDNDIINANGVAPSTCIDSGCLTNWPPLLAGPNDNPQPPYSLIPRQDGPAGTMQWAINGKPLYFFSQDTQPGDIKGDGAGGVWRIASTVPVLLNRAAASSVTDGEYLVSSGTATTYLPDGNGGFTKSSLNTDRLSLYTYDPDVAATGGLPANVLCSPAATPNCLDNWPPLVPADGLNLQDSFTSGPYSILRIPLTTDPAGASTQVWAYNGKPLYFFKLAAGGGDMNEGDTTGKAINNWRLARPTPTQVVSSSTSALGSYLASSGGNGVTLLPPANFDPSNAPTPAPFVRTVLNGANASTQYRDSFTLYTYDQDTLGTSTCTDGCLQNWPPVVATAAAVTAFTASLQGTNDGTAVAKFFDAGSPFSLVPVNPQNASTDGEMMWALNGKPLYYFIGDTAANQTNGENAGAAWSVARSAPFRASLATFNSTVTNTTGSFLVSDGVLNDSSGAVIPDGNAGPGNGGLGFALYTFRNDTAENTDPAATGAAATGNIVSVCTNTIPADGSPSCLKLWPALYAAPNAVSYGDYTIINRPTPDANGDVTEAPNARQWAYKGQPLYYFINDTAGEVRTADANGNVTVTTQAVIQGDGAGNGVWDIARINPITLTTPATP